MTTLRINFIRAFEQRSGSMVSLKSLVWIGVLVLPLIIAVVLGIAYVRYTEARSALRLTESDWERTRRQQEEALALRQQLDALRSYDDELMGWGRSRLPWHLILGNIQPHVPPEMQWRQLQMQQRLVRHAETGLTREHRLSISGRSLGPESEAQVELMRGAWTGFPPMSNWVERSVVTVFDDDATPGARREDRMFEITVQFHPGRFHAPAGR